MYVICFLPEIYFFISLCMLLLFFILYGLSSNLNFPNTCISNVFLSIVVLCYTFVLYSCNHVYSIDNNILIKTQSGIILSQLMIFFTIFILLITFNYNNKRNLMCFEYTFFILVSVGSFFILISTYNIILIFIILELQTLVISLLISIDKFKRYSIESSIKYFLLNTFSSLLLIFGFSIVYGSTGLLCISEIRTILHLLEYIDNNIVVACIALSSNFILIGLFFKIYSAPFNLWLSDVYQGTPKSVLVYISTVQLLFMLVFVFKIYHYMIYDIFHINTYFTYVLSILTIVFGSVGALYQTDIKRLISYSTITVNGLFMFTMLHENMILIETFFTYLLIYIVMVFLLLSFFMNITVNKKGINNIQDLFNMYSCNKVIANLLCFLIFSISGLPPFVGFIVKLFWLKSIIIEFNFFMLFFIIIFMLLIYYYFRFVKHAYILNYNNAKGIKSMDIFSHETVIIAYIFLISIFLLFHITIITYLIKIIVISMLYCF